REGQLARMGARIGDELLKIGKWQLRISAQNVGRDGGLRHRDQILVGIVGQVLVQKLVDREDRRGREQDRVAVGSRLRQRIDADNAVGAGFVLDNDRLR